MNEMIDKVIKELDENGEQYILMVKEEDGCSLSGSCDYSFQLASIAMMVETVMNRYIPECGRGVVNDIKTTVRNVIKMNKAEPNDATEKALLKLNKILSRK